MSKTIINLLQCRLKITEQTLDSTLVTLSRLANAGAGFSSYHYKIAGLGLVKVAVINWMTGNEAFEETCT